MTAPGVDPLAQAVMVARCGWDPTVAVSDVDLWLSGNGSSLLMLPSMHVTAVSAVEIHNRDNDIVDTLDTTDFDWDEDGELESRRWCGWPYGKRNIKVTYSGGYDPMPDDLAAALASLGKRTSGIVISQTRMGTATVTLAATIAAGGLLVTEEMVFDKYRIMRAA